MRYGTCDTQSIIVSVDDSCQAIAGAVQQVEGNASAVRIDQAMWRDRQGS